ncbi:exodeoxyribonuclease VII large subunit, partial [bacterium]|nr:exodeoxyribonuclease VII large subunit [bacterium]
MVKSVLESSLPSLWVEGELSNFKHHSSGHMYFTLKDDSSALPALMFRFANQKLAFTPENGMKVLACGRIKVYEPQGRYQLYVERMKPSGIGALALAFEQLKRRLSEEGLFDPALRKSLPAFPRTVAVITSATGAAVRDVIRVVTARSPMTNVVVVPAVVQGAGAAPSIVAGIRAVDEWGGADVIIVGRGGGSLEDLWAFNEESVARAIHAARTPIISAVGHEVDVTMSDFVADARAATPSNAAELAVADASDVARRVEDVERRLSGAVHGLLAGLAERVDRRHAAYAFRLPRDMIERSA